MNGDSLLSQVQPAPRGASLRPDRGGLSLIEGGSAAAALDASRLDILPWTDPAEQIGVTPRNYQTALSLLECAAKALEILYDRRDELEASLEDVSLRAEGAVVAAQAKVLDWQRLAAGLKSESQDLERQLAAMQQRAEAAERKLETERARADAAERQAANALGVSQGLHTKIISVFGRGSSAHKALMVAVDDADPLG